MATNDNLTRLEKFAIKSGITKGTPEDSGAGDLVYAKTVTFPTNERGMFDNSEEHAREIRSKVTLTNYVSGNAVVTVDLMYEGEKVQRLFREVFGATTANGAYAHTPDSPELALNTSAFSLVKSITTPEWSTLIRDFGDNINACESATVTGVVFAFNGAITATVTFKVDKASYDPAGFINDCTGDDPEGYYNIFDTTNYIRMNNADGIALDSAHDQDATSVEVSITRGFEECAAVFGGGGTFRKLREQSQPEVTVSLTYDCRNDTAAAFFNEYENQTAKKIEIYLQGALNTAFYSSYLFQFPKMEMMEAPSFADETAHETTAVFSMIDTDAAPAGMTTTVPYMEIVSKSGTLE